MTLFTINGSSIQGSSNEETARRIREGGFTTGSRSLDWALALHGEADDQRGKRYVELEQRLLVARGEPVVVYVFVPRQSTDPQWERGEFVSHTRCNERVWLGKVASEVEEPAIVWKQGQVYLPIERYTRLECVSTSDEHPLPALTVHEVPDCRLALSTLCPDQTMNLAHFVPQEDGRMHSIIRAGKRLVEGYFMNSLTAEQAAYRRALPALGFPSVDEKGQRIFGL